MKGGGERERAGEREQRGEERLSVTRGSELKKASRREPSVWMQSNLEKKGEKEGGREGWIKKEQASSSSSQKIHTNLFIFQTMYLMFMCDAFCWPSFELSKGKNRTNVLVGGLECNKHTRLSPWAVKRETRV